MCIIVDANLANRVFPREPNAADEYNVLTCAIFRGEANLVYGGSKLAREYQLCSRRLIAIIIELTRQGKARRQDDQSVNEREEELVAIKACVSDDPHIIALAQVSGVRLLCSDDEALRADFGSPRLLKKPRGKIWNRNDHRRLIREACSTCL